MSSIPYAWPVAISVGTRFSRAGNHLTQTVGLGIAILTLATMPGGWPTEGIWVLLSGIVAGLAVLYLVLALWEILRPPSEATIVFRYPRNSGTVHDLKWVDTLLGLIRCDRRSRFRRTDARIADYMARLLSDASSARLLTRDLSWSEAVEGELSALARNGDLAIISCASDGRMKTRPNVEKYREMGARVHTTEVASNVRMTSVDKAGARIVAIGHREGRAHVIRQSTDPKDPMFCLADTLFSALELGA